MTEPLKTTGAGALVATLEALGADTVFGIPGGAILPAYDPLLDSTAVRHVLVRHEQGAGHAATGYAQASGKVGVCMATSGPGATNLITPLADAFADSVPLVAITGQVPGGLVGSDAFQEADILGMTMPVTKHGYQVRDAADIPRVLAQAFHLAAAGRPGPVLVDITKDALQASTTFGWPVPLDLPGLRPVPAPHPGQVRAAARLLAEAKRPVLYVGGGVVKAAAEAELWAFAELTGAPLVTTLMALGAFPASHPQHLGMPGMHGSVAAVTALQRADLVVAIGARFDDRVTGRPETFARGAKIVHVDVDPAEIGKNRAVDVPVVGDAAEVLRELTAAAAQLGSADRREWWAKLDQWRRTYPLGYDPAPDGLLSPQQVIERLGQVAGPDAVYAAGVGQHQMWAAQFLPHERPRTWLNSGGLGTMGYAVPAAMGAKAARPDAVVWAVDGDGCFQMTSQELVTCAVEGLPIKVAVINNGALGMVRQWQTLFYGERYSSTRLGDGEGTRCPDFVRLAEAMGCYALRCDRPDDLDGVLDKAMSCNDRPVVVDFVVHQDAMVWPMVAAGAGNDEIQAARGLRPDFGDGTD